ncbi:MAG: phage major capsid protein [Actinobacteria bacterium]|nr:phage major capsid protein [Actinomycetota bacterium]
MDINEIKTQLSGYEEKVTAAIAKRDQEISENGEATKATASRVDELAKEYSEKSAELAEAMSGLKEDLADVAAKQNAATTRQPQGSKSIGGRFTESDEYKAYVASGANGRSKSFELGHTLGGMNTKTTFTGESLGDTAAYMYEVERFAEYVKDPDRMQFVRELLPTYGTSSGSIEFVRETGFTNNAGMVPEYAAGDSGEKPESAVAFEVVSTPLKTMAHWIPLTRQVTTTTSGST